MSTNVSELRKQISDLYDALQARWARIPVTPSNLFEGDSPKKSAKPEYDVFLLLIKKLKKFPLETPEHATTIIWNLGYFLDERLKEANVDSDFHNQLSDMRKLLTTPEIRALEVSMHYQRLEEFMQTLNQLRGSQKFKSTYEAGRAVYLNMKAACDKYVREGGELPLVLEVSPVFEQTVDKVKRERIISEFTPALEAIKEQADQLKKHGHQDAALELNQTYENIKRKCDSFVDGRLPFGKFCNQVYERLNTPLKAKYFRHELTPQQKNALLAIGTLGIGYLVAVAAKVLITGRKEFTVFEEADTKQKLGKASRAVEDLTITKKRSHDKTTDEDHEPPKSKRQRK